LTIQKDRPYLAYLQALIDTLWAGSDGTFAFISSFIPAVKPVWVTGTFGMLFTALAFALFTGIYTVFKQ
jgi:hypothetical protein